MTSIRRRSALPFAVLAAAVLAITTAAAGGAPVVSPAGAALQADAPNASPNASITVTNQSRDGRSVFVESATLPDGGFVVLEEAGPNGSVVGVSLPLSPGVHEGRVTLRGVPGAATNLSRLGTNTTLVATLHRDTDGDDRFDGLVAPGTDGAYTANGTPVADRARVRVPPDERPTAPAIAFANQTTNGTTVTIGSITLPDGGYVGVLRGPYNASNATRSAIGATDYLEPGSYANVTVTFGVGVPGSNATELNRTARLGAVAYRDTDGDRRFQYVPSNRNEDEPYVDGGPVNASAVVTVEAPNGTGAPAGNATTTPTGGNTTTPAPNATTPVENTTTSAPTPNENTTVPATTTAPTNTTATINTTTAPQTSSATAAPTTTPTATSAAETPTGPAPSTADPASGSDVKATAYGAGSDGREGILDNPLFPVLALTFAVFVVLVVATGQ